MFKMKQILILVLGASLFIGQQAKAQNTNATAAVVGGLAALGAGIAAVHQMQEQAELTATEWLLSNYPQYKQFSLKTLDFDGKKLKDLSSTSVITYKIQEFSVSDNKPVLGNKLVLLGFTSYGWVNDNGINFDKVKWFLIDQTEWINMMTTYTKIASGIKDESLIRKTLLNGKVVNKGVVSKKYDKIDFIKINGDMYLVGDYSSEMRFVYNERSMGIYLKETHNLIQMGRDDLIKIHAFFLDE